MHMHVAKNTLPGLEIKNLAKPTKNWAEHKKVTTLYRLLKVEKNTSCQHKTTNKWFGIKKHSVDSVDQTQLHNLQ